MNSGKAGLSGFRLLLLLPVLLLFQACTTISPKKVVSTEQLWQQRQQILKGLDNWILQGRIGFVSAEDSGSASLYWEQRGAAYTLRVIAPFGQGGLIISGDQSGVTLKTKDGEEYYAVSPERLIWRQTGWVIPVQRLRNWIVGLPSDETLDQYQLGEAGQIESLVSGDWQVTFKAYRDNSGVQLPNKMTVQNPDLTIKLAISKWQVPADE